MIEQWGQVQYWCMIYGHEWCQGQGHDKAQGYDLGEILCSNEGLVHIEASVELEVDASYYVYGHHQLPCWGHFQMRGNGQGQAKCRNEIPE